MERYHVCGLECLVVNWQYSAKWFDSIPIKILASLFVEIDKPILKWKSSMKLEVLNYLTSRLQYSYTRTTTKEHKSSGKDILSVARWFLYKGPSENQWEKKVFKNAEHLGRENGLFNSYLAIHSHWGWIIDLDVK